MAELGRLYMAIFLVGFWFFLPLVFNLFNLNSVSYDTISRQDINIEKPQTSSNWFTKFTGIDMAWAGNFMTSIGIFFNMYSYSIYNINPYIKFFLNFLQIITLIYVIFLIFGK